MKFIISGILGVCSILSFAQVGINTTTPESSTSLQISSASSSPVKRGFVGPAVTLTSLTSASPVSAPAEGLVVFNNVASTSIPVGYYFWTGFEWRSLNRTRTYTTSTYTDIRAAVLGYDPSSSGASAPSGTIVGTTNANDKKCAKFSTGTDSNNHSYCSYNLNKNVSFSEAFLLAKSLGGYLPVITTTTEWNFIKTNLLTGGGTAAGTNFAGAAWIGYKKTQYTGTDFNNSFIWITGETSRIGWATTGNRGANLEVNFLSGSNGISTATDGALVLGGNCTYISSDANRNWGSNNCNSFANSNYLIVEFQQ